MRTILYFLIFKVQNIFSLKIIMLMLLLMIFFRNVLRKKNVDMFLIALGPTGTVLSARLHQYGLRGLDVGHLNNSYDTVFLNKVRPEQIDFLKN
ncbi:GT-D fold domain-containing glycosyltransferase [Acinetobacter sp. ANC 4169]|uniref:GT-D fold domain-containing glycosyltransferase n=1 Tax=Acinetobacter sp. ANC 4169 TaxID=1977879 RepID=UPI0039B6FEC7